MVKIHNGSFRHVESELYNYKESKREISQIRNDIINVTSSKPFDDVNVQKPTPSDPTLKAVTRLTTHKRLKYLEHITSNIEYVYNQLPKDKKRLVELRYWTKPQELTWDGIANKLNISKRQAQRWRNEIVETVAVRLGWR